MLLPNILMPKTGFTTLQHIAIAIMESKALFFFLDKSQKITQDTLAATANMQVKLKRLSNVGVPAGSYLDAIKHKISHTIANKLRISKRLLNSLTNMEGFLFKFLFQNGYYQVGE